MDLVRVLGRWVGVRREHWHSTYGVHWSDHDNPAQHTYDAAIQNRPSKYLYSQTMLTRPSAWRWPRQETLNGWTESGPRYFALTSNAMISHPARKGVLLHSVRHDGPRRWHVAFADASAATTNPLHARPAAAHFNGQSRSPEGRGTAVLHTLDGVRGIDF